MEDPHINNKEDAIMFMKGSNNKEESEILKQNLCNLGVNSS